MVNEAAAKFPKNRKYVTSSRSSLMSCNHLIMFVFLWNTSFKVSTGPKGETIISERILEAYIGEYASGKSEVALNRALSLLDMGHKNVTLVDLDLVEPFYTLRPIKKELEEKGLTVLAWETKNTMGLGEAGSLLKPEMRWAIWREGSVIFDVGYGIEGAKKIRLVESAKESGLQIYVVINIARPMTGDVETIVEYVNTLGPVNGLINNSHLGDDTDVEIIQEGAGVVGDAAKILGLPIIWTTADIRLAPELGTKDVMGNPVFYLKRHMNRSFW